MAKEKLYKAVIKCMNPECNSKHDMDISLNSKYYTFRCQSCGRVQVRYLGYSDLYNPTNHKNISVYRVLKKEL